MQLQSPAPAGAGARFHACVPAVQLPLPGKKPPKQTKAPQISVLKRCLEAVSGGKAPLGHRRPRRFPGWVRSAAASRGEPGRGQPGGCKGQPGGSPARGLPRRWPPGCPAPAPAERPVRLRAPPTPPHAADIPACTSAPRAVPHSPPHPAPPTTPAPPLLRRPVRAVPPPACPPAASASTAARRRRPAGTGMGAGSGRLSAAGGGA